MKKQTRWIWFIIGGLAALAVGASLLLVTQNVRAEQQARQAESSGRINWAPDYTSPLVIPAAAFVNDGLTIDYFYSFAGGELGGPDCWEAPVYLPDDVRILQYNASINDSDAVHDMSVYLRRKYNYSVGADTQVMGTIVSSGSTGFEVYGDFSIDYPRVTYPEYSYILTLCGGSSNTGLISLRVYYLHDTTLPIVIKH
jgi:hypothetical protein